MRDFVLKHYPKDQYEETLYHISLPLSNITSYIYSDMNPTRPYTVRLLKDFDTEIAVDDGSGSFTETIENSISSSVIEYDTNTISITWEPTYLASLTTNPLLEVRLTSDTKENHLEFIDLLGELLQEYKEEELEIQYDLYKPDEIPLHLIDLLAKNYNWVIDRYYSDEESYIREQLKYLFEFYKNRNKLSDVEFMIILLNKRIKFYNLLFKNGEYNDLSKYERFDFLRLRDYYNGLDVGSTDEILAASDIESLYQSIYSDTSDYYPSKHFLIELALDFVTENSTLLDKKYVDTIREYTLRMKSKTQFPHFTTYLGIDANSNLTEQSTSDILYKLTDTEQTLSIFDYETIKSGPEGVKSIAMTKIGAWVVLPLLMNSSLEMNSGLRMGMTKEDFVYYFQSFKVGTGSYADTLTNDYLDLQTPILSSSNMIVEYDDDYFYITLIVNESEVVNQQITEVGIYRPDGVLSFYAKHPAIYKTKHHKLLYKFRLSLFT